MASFKVILYTRTGRDPHQRPMKLKDAIATAERHSRLPGCYASVRRLADGKLIGEALRPGEFVFSP